MRLCSPCYISRCCHTQGAAVWCIVSIYIPYIWAYWEADDNVSSSLLVEPILYFLIAVTHSYIFILGNADSVHV